MALIDDFRSKIEARIFSADIASSATLSSLVSPSTDKWGDNTASYSAGASIDVIPFTYVSGRNNYQPFGDLQEGDVDLVVKYSVTVTIRDKITFNSTPYFIAEIDDSAFIANGLVVRIIRCRRIT